MVFNLLGRSIVVNPVLLKAHCPSVVTVEGICTLSNPLFAKAPLEISLTSFPPMALGIITLFPQLTL